jgi:membrane protein implicated in regulation of membrane protease activity
MNAILILLAASSLLGLVLGFYLSWLAIGVSGFVLAFVSAVVLQREGFGSLAGIAIIVVCLTLSQLAYLIGVTWVYRRDRSLSHHQPDNHPGEHGYNHIPSEYKR